MLSKLYKYLNPLSHLGERKYSILFPAFGMALAIFLSETAYKFIPDPASLGIIIIFVSIALIIYFSFRDGIIGALISTSTIIAYYFYITFQHTPLSQRQQSIDTIIALAFVYYILAITIGGLKVTIDRLIIKEEDEKIRLKTIIQQLPVGVIITDKDGVVTQTNRKVDQILGAKIPKGFVMGKDDVPGMKINGQSIRPNGSPLIQSVRQDKAIVNREFEITTPSGKTKFIQVSSQPIHNTKGEIIAATSTIYDLTPQKELEDRKDDFINMASHELKTPLTSMKLYIGSLKSKIKNKSMSESSRIVGSIEYQTSRIQELVNNLLDVSKLQTKKLHFSKERFDINTLIRETMDSIRATTNKKIIFKKSKENFVYADKFRIYQVITNLLTNAIKYSPNDKEIVVKAQKDRSMVTISVQDFGIGIAKKEINNIFSRLYQVTDANGKTFPGLGMGLYISKEIIKKHNGRIWVESEKDKGSTFYFSLPIKNN